MAQAAVAADVGQPLDVVRDLALEVALDLERLDDFAQALLVLGREVLDPRVRVDPGLREDLLRRREPNAEDSRESDLDALVAREIDAGDTSHYP